MKKCTWEAACPLQAGVLAQPRASRASAEHLALSLRRETARLVRRSRARAATAALHPLSDPRGLSATGASVARLALLLPFLERAVAAFTAASALPALLDELRALCTELYIQQTLPLLPGAVDLVARTETAAREVSALFLQTACNASPPMRGCLSASRVLRKRAVESLRKEISALRKTQLEEGCALQAAEEALRTASRKRLLKPVVLFLLRFAVSVAQEVFRRKTSSLREKKSLLARPQAKPHGRLLWRLLQQTLFPCLF